MMTINQELLNSMPQCEVKTCVCNYDKHCIRVEVYKCCAHQLQKAEIAQQQKDIDNLQEFADALHLSTIRLYDIEVIPFESVKNWAKTFGIKIIGGSDDR